MMNDAMKNVGDTIFRNVLNDMFKRPEMTPDNCVVAIYEDVSLWNEGKEEILARTKMVPGFLLRMAGSYVGEAERQYGSMSKLALEWLKTDQPVYYSVIINTPGGEEWLDVQVKDILKGIGVT